MQLGCIISLNAALDPYETFRKAIRGQLTRYLRSYQNGQIDAGELHRTLRRTLDRAYTSAFKLGLSQVSSRKELSDFDKRWIGGEKRRQHIYLERFIDDLESGNLRLDPEKRIRMYDSAVDSVYWQGHKRGLPNKKRIDWVLHPAEHCMDCLALAAGGPYTRKTLPTVPRAGKTRCKMGCKCTLSVRDL